jgi:hypothetical protein
MPGLKRLPAIGPGDYLDPATEGITREILVFIIGSPKMVIVLWVMNHNQIRTGGKQNESIDILPAERRLARRD